MPLGGVGFTATAACVVSSYSVSKPFDRERGEQTADVAEVVRRGGVRHAGAAGDLTQAEAPEAVLGDDLDGRAAQRVREVAVVVAVRRS